MSGYSFEKLKPFLFSIQSIKPQANCSANKTKQNKNVENLSYGTFYFADIAL
jgi:hypothetical protein